MKQKLINIKDDHYVVVDNSEIKEGDWCLYKNKFGGQFICQAYVYERTLMFDDGSFNRSLGEGITPQKDECKKITHSTQPLYKNDFWAIQELKLSEVKELIGGVDVEKKADDIIPNLLHKEYVKIGFIGGYNQALEDNKDKKYTEEDLRMAYKEGAKSQRFNAHLDGSEKTIDETIQSLQPKTEWEVTFDEQGKLRLV